MEAYFHLFSDGAQTSDFCISEADFVNAVSRIGICSLIADVKILGYGLQNTHCHILIKGERDQCLIFKEEYQQRAKRYFSTVSRDVAFSLSAIELSGDEDLGNLGIYVICQATKDGKRVMPYDDKWSSAPLYFRTANKDLLWTSGEDGTPMPISKISEIPIRQQKVLFRTHIKLPEEWRICRGMILPSCFVDVKGFEDLYGTHNAFRVFLGNSRKKDEEVIRSMSNAIGVSFHEEEAREIAAEISEMMFHTRILKSLRANERLMLARELRSRHRMSLSQISRRVFLPEEEIRKFLK